MRSDAIQVLPFTLGHGSHRSDEESLIASFTGHPMGASLQTMLLHGLGAYMTRDSHPHMYSTSMQDALVRILHTLMLALRALYLSTKASLKAITVLSCFGAKVTLRSSPHSTRMKSKIHCRRFQLRR